MMSGKLAPEMCQFAATCNATGSAPGGGIGRNGEEWGGIGRNREE